MDRMVLRDDQWERMAPQVPGKAGDPGRSAADNRLFLEAVLWIVRVGAPWRDLPESFGKWNSVFRRFRRWSLDGVFGRIFEALSADADFEYVIVDGTIVRVHQHGTGARGGTRTQIPCSPSRLKTVFSIWGRMPACSLQSRTRRARARACGPP